MPVALSATDLKTKSAMRQCCLDTNMLLNNIGSFISSALQRAMCIPGSVSRIFLSRNYPCKLAIQDVSPRGIEISCCV